MAADERQMQLALDLASEAAADDEVPVGAVVVLDGVVIGRGRNCPVGSSDPTAHAEILALREAGGTIGNYRLSGSVLYCTVEPCLMCLGAMLHARVERLVYGASDPKVGGTRRLAELRDGGVDFNHGFAVVGGVLERECAGLLHDFFRARRESR